MTFLNEALFSYFCSIYNFILGQFFIYISLAFNFYYFLCLLLSLFLTTWNLNLISLSRKHSRRFTIGFIICHNITTQRVSRIRSILLRSCQLTLLTNSPMYVCIRKTCYIGQLEKNPEGQNRSEILPNGGGIIRLMRSASRTMAEASRNFGIKGNIELAIHMQVPNSRFCHVVLIIVVSLALSLYRDAVQTSGLLIIRKHCRKQSAGLSVCPRIRGNTTS